MKNTESIFHIFVRKLSQKMWKILSRDEIGELWESSGWSLSRLAYALTQTRAQWYLLPIAPSLYHIGDIDDPTSLYWQMIAALIRLHSPSGAIIASEKSAEIHLRDYSLPDTLILYTRSIEKRISLGEGRVVHFRILQSWEKKWYKSMYPLLARTWEKVVIDGVLLHTLSIPASLLDMLMQHRQWEGIGEWLVLKFLKKHEKHLSREELGVLVEHRYIRSVNRLRSIAQQHGYDSLYQICLDIIRREGGNCFVSV